MTTITNPHFVGSLNTEDAEESFTLISTLVGPDVLRAPDGEFGERWHWLLFQGSRIEAAEGISRIGDMPYELAGFDVRPLSFDGTVPASEVSIPNLGYADAAVASYEVFKQFKADGRFSPSTRFQVSLPSPLGVTSNFFSGSDVEKRAFERIYAAALEVEVEKIRAVIPDEELAIQLDCAIEFVYIENVQFPGYSTDAPWFTDDGDDVLTVAAEHAAHFVNSIPESVHVGVHLCYGDVAEEHFVQPEDTANLVAFANAFAAELHRSLNWVHLPVPVERDDAAYYAPLSGLRLPEGTELFLGLVHREDGVEGLERRIAAAGLIVDEFGIATECGFGRGPKEELEDLFRLHRL